MYEAKVIRYYSEQDNYENGCIPETGRTGIIDLKFNNDTIRGLLKDIKNFFDVGDDALELNSCDEDGRIDISRHEDEYGFDTTDYEIERWQNGEINLYRTIYTAYVTKNIPVKF